MAFSGRDDKVLPLAEKYRALSPRERVEEDTVRRGEHYGNLMASFLDEMETIQSGGTLFLGDSITEQFPLDKALPDKNIYNRGIGGDRVTGLRERLDVCVDALQPAKIYIMIGTNDVIYPQHESVVEWGEQYRLLLEEIDHYVPHAQITVFSILPLGPRFDDACRRLPEHNEMIKKITREKEIAFIDLGPLMKDENGYLQPFFTHDDVHLTLEGYVAWLMGFPEPFDSFKPVWNLASDIKKLVNSTVKPAAVNPEGHFDFPGGRGPDQLILYTPDYTNDTTGTNEWGREVVVRKGVVTALSNNNTPIPSDGFIISGHGSAAQWMGHHLHPGTRVAIEGELLLVQEPDPATLSPGEQLRYYKNSLICVMAKLHKEGYEPDNASDVEKLWKIIVELLLQPDNINSTILETIRSDIASLKNE